MKYILLERQYKLLTEVLGVPENIFEAAVDFYNIFKKHLSSINDKQETYFFKGDVDIVLGDRKKIVIDSYTLKVEVSEIDSYDGPAQLVSMGMGQSFEFDRNILMKRTDQSTTAQFTLSFVVSENWAPSDLLREFELERNRYISSLSHEIKHKYDKQSKQIDLIGQDAEYHGIQEMPRIGIPVLDNRFKLYMYYTHVAENLVRATEVSSHIKLGNVTKEGFKKFLQENETFQMLVKIKNFTYEDLINGIRENMDIVDETLDSFGRGSNSMSDEDKINEVLWLYYVNLVNTKLEIFYDYIENPFQGILDLISTFGGSVDERKSKIDKIRMKFENYLTRYVDNPNQFFIDEINKFHDVAEQLIRKLSKLYAIASDNEVKTESIINWELYGKIMEKKNGPLKLESKIKRFR